MGTTIQFTNNAGMVRKRLNKALERYLTEAGMYLEGKAKKALEDDPRRVDTGLLRNSITFALAGRPANITTYHADKGNKGRSGERKKAGDKDAGSIKFGVYSGTAPVNDGKRAVYIGTNVEYAQFVHEGVSGRNMAPNRFLVNPIQRNRDKIKDKLGDILKEEMA